MGLESQSPRLAERRLALVKANPAPAPVDPVTLRSIGKVLRKRVEARVLVVLSDRAALAVADVLDPPADARPTTGPGTT